MLRVRVPLFPATAKAEQCLFACFLAPSLDLFFFRLNSFIRLFEFLESLNFG